MQILIKKFVSVIQHIFNLFYIYNRKKKHIDDIKSISFSGGGWYIFYYIGAIRAMQKLKPDLHKTVLANGCSSGALAALSYLTNIKGNKMYSIWLKYAITQRKKTNICDTINYVEICEDFFETIKDKITDDVLRRIKISTSKLNYFYFINKMKNSKDIDHLKLNLYRTSHIPYLMKRSLFADDKKYVDGGLTCNLPICQTYPIENTLYIGSMRYNSYVDIYPNLIFNLYYVLYPPNETTAKYLYRLGYVHTKNYFN